MHPSSSCIEPSYFLCVCLLDNLFFCFCNQFQLSRRNLCVERKLRENEDNVIWKSHIQRVSFFYYILRDFVVLVEQLSVCGRHLCGLMMWHLNKSFDALPTSFFFFLFQRVKADGPCVRIGWTRSRNFESWRLDVAEERGIKFFKRRTRLISFCFCFCLKTSRAVTSNLSLFQT